MSNSNYSKKQVIAVKSKFFDKNQSSVMTNVISLPSQKPFICAC